MKIKEILTNKWGWAGAVILPIVGYLFGLTSGTPLILPGTGYIICDLLKMCTGMEFAGFAQAIILSIISLIIIGFIAGLIAQKLWRKFK